MKGFILSVIAILWCNLLHAVVAKSLNPQPISDVYPDIITNVDDKSPPANDNRVSNMGANCLMKNGKEGMVLFNEAHEVDCILCQSNFFVDIKTHSCAPCPMGTSRSGSHAFDTCIFDASGREDEKSSTTTSRPTTTAIAQTNSITEKRIETGAFDDEVPTTTQSTTTVTMQQAHKTMNQVDQTGVATDLKNTGLPTLQLVLIVAAAILILVFAAICALFVFVRKREVLKRWYSLRALSKNELSKPDRDKEARTPLRSSTSSELHRNV